MKKHQYESPRHPVGFGLAALMLTVLTLGALVVAPARYETPTVDPGWANAGPGLDLVAVAVTCYRYGENQRDGEN